MSEIGGGCNGVSVLGGGRAGQVSRMSEVMAGGAEPWWSREAGTGGQQLAQPGRGQSRDSCAHRGVGCARC